jgi:hypothetical protein
VSGRKTTSESGLSILPGVRETALYRTPENRYSGFIASSLMRRYKHHLYPRYMAKKGEIPPWGNADTVVEVSFTQHLMFHWCNYQLWGNLEDKVAYSVMLGKGEEGQILASRLAAKAKLAKMKADPEFRENIKQVAQKASKAYKTKLDSNPDFKKKMKNAFLKGSKSALSLESRAKRLETFRKNNHSQGPKNSQYGTMWVTDGTANRKIKRGDPLPEGFKPGRKMT